MKIIQALIRRRPDAAGGMAIDNMYTSVLSKKYVDICGQDTRTPAGLLQRY